MTTQSYDDIAEWYDGWVGTGSMREDPFWPATEALMGEVAGQRICDLACGQGRVARHLASLGAHVVGIDLSARLLAIARHHEIADPRGIEYMQADVQNLEVIAEHTFDGVLCVMALMDIPDLTTTVHTVARIVEPNGWFIFSILHPCYNTPPSGELATPDGWVRTVSRYFTEGYWRSEARTGPPGRVGAYHRTLSTYINTLTDAGLVLERVSEPRATFSVAEQRPVWAEVPAVLVAQCRKNAPDRGHKTL